MTPEGPLILATCLLALVSGVAPMEAPKGLEPNKYTARESRLFDPSPERTRVRKRRYYPWTIRQRNQISVLDASTAWKPASYQLSRPYYIPIYGVSGRIPVFYPPQPLYLNPGVPQDNPMKPPFRAPSYLPPREPTTTTSRPETTPFIGIRINDGDDDDDDMRPIWGDGGLGMMQLSAGQNNLGPAPTRLPAVSPPTFPPLVHNDPKSPTQRPGVQNQGFVQSEVNEVRPTRPPSALQRPSTTPRPTTVAPASGPSNCVWAIISCCSASNPSLVSQNCFEQRGCAGPFWGASPCESDFARAALAAAARYYNS